MTPSTALWRTYLNPRFELILFLSVLFEVCVPFGFFGLVLASVSAGRHSLSLPAYGGVYLLALYGARILLALRISDRTRRLSTAILAIGSILWLMRVTVYGEYGVGDLGWIGAALVSVGRIFIAFSPAALVAVAGVAAWWRGVTLSQAAFDFESVGFRFRAGVLLLALLVVINTYSARIELGALLTAYFFCALLAVALARQEDLGRTDAQVSLPLRGPWLGILAGAAGAVLVLGALLGLVLSPQGVALLLQALSPLQPLLMLALLAFLLVTALIVEAIVNFFALVLYRLGGGTGGFELFRLPDRPPLDLEHASEPNVLAQFVDPTLTACATVLFLLVLASLVFGLNRMRAHRDAVGQETRESVPVRFGNPFQNLRRLLRLPQLAASADDSTSVRRIYAAMLAAAARRGFPRRDAATPYEHLPDVRAALQGADAEERAITDAYVRVHYGEHRPSPDELHRVREAWQKVRALGSKAADDKKG